MMKQRHSPRHEVVEAMRARILAGEFARDPQLPSVRAIADQYRCAPNTAMEALRILAREGLLVIREREGAKVVLPQQSIGGPIERLARSRTSEGLFRPSETVEMLSARLIDEAHPDALEAFGLPQDGRLGLREYLVRSGDRVITYGTSYIHPEVWEAVAQLREPVEIPDGIIGAVRRVLGRDAVAVPTRYQADAATEEEARHLGVVEDSPVLVAITECLADDGLVEWNMSVHPSRHWAGL